MLQFIRRLARYESLVNDLDNVEHIFPFPLLTTTVFSCLHNAGFYLRQKAFSHKIRKFLFNLLSFVAAGLNIYIYRKVTSFDK